MSSPAVALQAPKYTPNRSHLDTQAEFLCAADDYSRQGMTCFNTCVSKFDNDALLGYEKRCMQGCLQVNFQMFTVNAT